MASLKYTVDVDTRGARSSIAQLERSIGGLGSAIAGGFAVGEIVAFGDSIVGLQNKLRSLTGDQALVSGMFNDITRIAGAARAPLQETGDLYFRIARAAADLGITQQQTADITESLAKSMSMTGATAQETSGALLQLGQALQSGRFQGDELRSVLENMPIVSKAMAEELGVTIGELRKLGSEGKITSDVFVRAMQKNKQAIDDAFARSVPTAQQALNNLKTAMGIAFSEIATEPGLGKIFVDAAKAIISMTSDVKGLASAIKDLINLALALGVAFLTLGRGAIIMRAITASVNGLSLALRAMAGGSAFALMLRNFTGIRNSIVGIVGAFGPFAKATGQIMVAARSAGFLGKAFARVGQILFSMVAILANVLRIAFRFAGWIGVLLAIGQALDFVLKKFFGFSIVDWAWKKVSWLWEKLKEFAAWLGIYTPSADTSKPAPAPAPDKNLFGTGDIKTPPATGGGKGGGRSQAEINKELKQSITEVTKAYKDQVSTRLEQLALDLRLMGVSEDQAELERAKYDVMQNQKQALADLAQKEQEVKDNNELSAASRRKNLDLIAQQRVQVNAAAAEELAKTEELIKKKQALILEQERLNNVLALQQLALDNKKALTDLEEQLGLVGLYGDALEDANLKLQVQDELQGKLLDIEKKKLELERNRTQLGEARFAQEMANLAALSSAAQAYANDRLAAEQKLVAAQRKTERTDIKFAIGKRMEEIARSVDPAIQAVETMNSVFDNMGRAIDNFVETGKFKFGDFARSIVADIAKIALKAAATKILGGIFGGIFKLPGRAAGGPVQGNTPYLVGEQGPELFVPGSNGSIMTNAALNKNAGGMGAQPVVNNTYITNNISAIDSRSVAQMFVENRKALLGASTMARKELPYG